MTGSLCRPAEAETGSRSFVFLLVWFALNALATRVFCADPEGYSSFWTASSALAAGFLVLPLPRALSLAACCFVINMLVNRLVVMDAAEGALASLLNPFQAVLAAWGIRRFCGATSDLTRVRRLIPFAFVALASAGMEAAVGVLVEVRWLGDTKPAPSEWLQWVFCDATGLLVSMPVTMLLVRSRSRRTILRLRGGAALLAIVATALCTLSAFALPRSGLFLFLFPCLVVLAGTIGMAGVFTAIFLVALYASAMTAHGIGPIAGLSPDGSLLREGLMQPFLASLFLAVLPINAMLGERQRTEARLRIAKTRLEHLATHDTLTGLMNRQRFRRRVAAVLGRGHLATVLFLDIDHFKQINDGFGHQAGDRLLRDFAGRLLLIAGESGCAARLGGDEFALLLPDEQGGEGARAFCAEMMDRFRVPYAALGHKRVTVSAGLASGAGVAADALLHDADIALYEAKAGGRDDVRFFKQTPSPAAGRPASSGNDGLSARLQECPAA
ncbi:diguanylate cyclase domain-containing protein [Rhizosaccharibacter radicis]|uniref:Diguanylate cyclase n=1 Tax=Rhizosaccharibacter radicis TaxID=2782605 RepID=A0ABT1W1E6_9PROT|nr:diguanylate cyclase [Acetobacteraceae bacterium KSS12]